jgi:hypothetical protein
VGLCDKCGKDYFVSCHDCLHILTMLFHTARKTLILLPATEKYNETRELLLSFTKFYTDKIVACSTKEKEN